MNKKRRTVTGLLILLSVLFLAVAGTGLYLGSRYISDKLLQSGEAMATDLALLVKNNFELTDDEVAYMKSLTFNEMEVDPINRRLMDVGNGVVLNAAVTNVYLLFPLPAEEYRSCPDQQSAEFLGVSMDTTLDGMWLLNGRINEEGVFEAAQREDIYRYTALDDDQRWGMEHQEAFGTFTSDAWGSFITGYAPFYTVEGNFVGLLGVDMDPDPYQSSAQHMSLLIIVLFALIIVLFSGLSIFFYLRWGKVKELERQFAFFSDMSHEMRTPLNGILGMAALSKGETNVAVLQNNFATVESSGKYLLKLINHTLDYQGEAAVPPVDDTAAKDGPSGANWSELRGKRFLICEDHPVNAEILRKMVERTGALTEWAENGQCGLARFAESPVGYFDAVLMDIRMPVMDGIEATQRIRRLDRADAKRIPIIAVTANSYEEDIQNTKAAGMNAHITKPVEPAVLFAALSAAICPQETKRKEGL